MVKSQESPLLTGSDPIDWLEQHGDSMFAYAMARVGDVDVAEDLVQDALLAALSGRDRFANRSSVRTWLIGILKHKIADHRRKTAGLGRGSSPPRTATEQELEEWMQGQFGRGGKWKIAPGNWRGDPHDLIEHDEFRMVLMRCIEKLPEPAADALLLKERQGFSPQRLAEFLQISTNHLGVMLYRARSALRRCLEVHWFQLKDGRGH